MSYHAQLRRSLVVSILAMIGIILIVLYPRELTVTVEKYELKASSTVTWKEYAGRIQAFVREAWQTGSLGRSRDGQPVEAVVGAAMGRSLAVIAGSFALSAVLGMGKGIFDHLHARRKSGLFGGAASMLLQSTPDFLFILLVEWAIIRFMPSVRFFGHVGLSAFVLPVLLVSFFPTLYMARITHNALDAHLHPMYIQVARAKGLKERSIFRTYVLRNSLPGILAHSTTLLVYLLSNLLMVEYLMNYPGAAARLYQAIDYSRSLGTGPHYEPGIIIETAFCFMLLILLVQGFSLWARKRLDPRPEGGEEA
ncbi:ABC transporter permease subunit [Gorillibacterium sp. sgz500922]|uniref:ABC transporter permease subunit n=1 Tax=Gorillibacterium sp. sgz500922 TaxID=3446694 RepID=UPI003F6744E1